MLSCAVYGNELCYFAEMAFVSYLLPETSSIPSAVSTQCRLVTDRQTDIHGAETTFVRSITAVVLLELVLQNGLVFTPGLTR